jgi:replicative DNA helicase
MKFSAPIYLLKQQAKALSRKECIPLHRALDRIANREGFRTWSLLASKASPEQPAAALRAQLRPGDLVLLAAKPGHGKTLVSLDLAIRTMKEGYRAAFFTLHCTGSEVAELFKALGENPSEFLDAFLIDDSDEISADYVIAKLASASPNTLVVIDYLQLLDQRRQNAELAYQVRRLRDFARERRLVVLCLSQIDRSYDPAKRPFPALGDVRLPNPLDLSLFDRACFLNRGKMRIG